MSTKELKILVVDSDDEYRENLLELISAVHDKVYSAATPEDALAVFRREQPAIIFADISAFQPRKPMAKKLLSVDDPHVLVTFLTGYSTAELIRD